MRTTTLVLALALLASGFLAAAAPTSASPCRNVGECIDRALDTLGCWDAGGDPFTNPLDWTPGHIVVCALAFWGPSSHSP